MRRIYPALLVAVGLGMSAGTASAQSPEVLPPPRPVEEEQPARIELTRSGYDIILTRRAAEKLRKTLDTFTQEQMIADALRAGAMNEEDAEVREALELAALLISREVPKMREALRENMGPNGVVISVYGIESKPKRDRPLLRRIGQALPPDLQEKARKIIKVARTTPVYVGVEPRE